MGVPNVTLEFPKPEVMRKHRPLDNVRWGCSWLELEALKAVRPVINS